MTDSKDILDETNSTTGVNTVQSAPANLYRIWLFALVGFALLGLIISLMMGSKETSPDIVVSNISKSNDAYYLVLAEPHPGIRLARLNDFVQTYPNSQFTESARTQRATLESFEEIAWSALTDVVFDIEAEDTTKKSAVEVYENGWGQLRRSEQLALLIPDKSDNDETGFKPITKKSKFADGGEPGDLVGAPMTREPFRPQFRIEPETIETRNSQRIVEARVRTKKSPTYPRGARRRKVPGLVTLSLDIDRRGRVVDTQVISVYADRYERDFIKAAVRAAERTRFYPKTVNGRPVGTRGYVQRYSFKVSR